MQNVAVNSSRNIALIKRRLTSTINKNNFLLAILVSLSLLILGLGIGRYANKILPIDTSNLSNYTLEPGNALKYMAHWDGIVYISIAQHGYTNSGLDNFFPGYPLLIHLVNYVIPSTLDSALAISWASLVFAIYFYIKIVRKLFDIKDNSVIEAVVFYIFFPSAIFLMAPYTESLFSALALGGIYFALNKRYLLASVLIAIATATHVTGVLVLLFVLMILFEKKLSYLKLAISFIIGSLGLVAFASYLKVKYNAPLSFITAQKAHGWLIQSNYSYLYHTADIFNLFFIALIILAAIYWWGRNKSFSIYSALFLLIPFIGRQFGGFDRYVLVAFPIPLMIYGYLKNKRIGYLVVLILFVALWSYVGVEYMTGYIGS